MTVKVLTRHFEPPVDMKKSLGGRLGAIVQKYFPNASHASIVVSLENHRYIVDCLVRIKGVSFHAHDENHQILQCVDDALKKIEIQMKRYKDKMIRSGRKSKETE